LNFLFLKIEGALAVFTGVIGSMFVCALIAVHGPGKLARTQAVPTEKAGELELPELPELPSSFSVREVLLPPPPAEDDPILGLYRSPGLRDRVVAFFAALCGSGNTAAVILSNAEAFDISPGLAFALCWEESRYNPLAVNRKNRDQSIDRGLFQLNSRSFPNIAEPDFFNPSINAWYGMAHLRLCLNTGGTEIAGLAMYNAGTGRVRNLGAPKNTLDYIHRILERRLRIEEFFWAEFSPSGTPYLAEPVELEDAAGEGFAPVPAVAALRPARPRLVRLAPLSGVRSSYP
jgi:hypothetical protein